MTYDELFQLEGHLETGFAGCLRGLVSAVYKSRDPRTVPNEDAPLESSPRIEIKATVGEVQNHVHNFSDNTRWSWDAWNGELETLIITNRQADATMSHIRLLGLVRYRLQLFYLINEWPKFQQTIVLTDIREAGTVDSFVDENDLDYSRISWQLLFNINPAAWPLPN